MGNVIKKMNYEIPETFFWNHIFLSTHMAKATYDSGSAIQAVLFPAFWGVAHNKFLLKVNSPTVIKKYTTAKVNILSTLRLHPCQRLGLTTVRYVFFTEQLNYF